MFKTKDYTLKAVRSYRDRYDFFNAKTPKGTKERAAAVGLDLSGVADLIIKEIERREAAARLSQAVQDLPEELPEDPPFM